MNRLCVFLIRKSIDRNLVRYHECRIETQTEMTDDLVFVCLVLIFCQEILCTGKCDLVNVLFHFLGSHTDTIILDGDRLVLGINGNLNLILRLPRLLILAHQRQLFQLRDRVASVGNQLTIENIMIGIKPFLNDRENILAVD